MTWRSTKIGPRGCPSLSPGPPWPRRGAAGPGLVARQVAADGVQEVLGGPRQTTPRAYAVWRPPAPVDIAVEQERVRARACQIAQRAAGHDAAADVQESGRRRSRSGGGPGRGRLRARQSVAGVRLVAAQCAA